MSDHKKFNVVIISGAWGVVAHLPAWRVLSNEVEVVGIMTSREQTAVAAARDNDISRAYWDIAKLCADPDIDIVDVGTQPRVRQGLVSAVVSAGKHCYSGIPFATDATWSRRLLDEQTCAGVVGMVDATIQAVPAVVRMKELISEGAIGEPWFAQVTFNLQVHLYPPADYPYKWFVERGSGASGLRNLGCHAIHPLVALLGPVAEVVGANEKYLDHWTFGDSEVVDVHNPDTSVAVLRLESGVLASLTTSWVAADGVGWSFEVHGRRGRLLCEGRPFPSAENTRLYHGAAGRSYVPTGEWLEIPQRLRSLPGSLLDPALSNELVAKNRRAGPHDLVMGRMFRDMIEAIGSGNRAHPDFVQAHHVQQVIEALYRSQETRAWEKVVA